MKTYITLENLETYKLARELSELSWEIYSNFDWITKKIIGNQFIESTDSVGANIAEGYGRFHYMDKVKFYYNSRGSLFESKHWIELLLERKLIDKKYKVSYFKIYTELRPALNGLIRSLTGLSNEKLRNKGKNNSLNS